MYQDPIGFGTDLLGETHAFQGEEFLIRREVMRPIDIIRSATVVNAALLQRPEELGVVRPGALAVSSSSTAIRSPTSACWPGRASA